ncbi:DUF1010 domain-containing protein [Acidovorax sp. HDW3]|uniref:DUF1010 domain-containing protein n=1 Tax=Acidovorax sp. HDW3 TaxID=2714923 RepID=UPI001F10962D|nr:DUF1010 domain-containing protein [Acidovorax sp. HDW3]
MRCRFRHFSFHATPPPWHSAISWVAPAFKSERFLLAFGSNHSSQPTATRRLNSGR